MSSRVETTKARPLPMVLVVGATKELVDTCTAAATLSAAIVRECDVASANTMATQWMPLAIVIPEDVYDFDPQEFDALARDVRAGIVTVADQTIGAEALQQMLIPAMALAEQLRAQ